MFASSVKPPLMENPLSLFWQAIDVEEFSEGINLPMMEDSLKEVQELSPPRTPSPLFFWPQSNLPLWLQAPPPVRGNAWTYLLGLSRGSEGGRG